MKAFILAMLASCTANVREKVYFPEYYTGDSENQVLRSKDGDFVFPYEDKFNALVCIDRTQYRQLLIKSQLRECDAK